jgi:hypothetical protein
MRCSASSEERATVVFAAHWSGRFLRLRERPRGWRAAGAAVGAGAEDAVRPALRHVGLRVVLLHGADLSGAVVAAVRALQDGGVVEVNLGGGGPAAGEPGHEGGLPDPGELSGGLQIVAGVDDLDDPVRELIGEKGRAALLRAAARRGFGFGHGGLLSLSRWCAGVSRG